MSDMEPESRPEDRRREAERDGRRRDRALPILLILIGGLLLLGNLGLFDWRAVFGVLELWPLLLIALGIDILTRGSYRLWVVLGAVVLGALMWSGGPDWMGGGFSVQRETHTIDYALSDAERAEVELNHGVGSLRLASLPEGSGSLLAGEIVTGRGERLERSFDVSGGTAVLRLRAEQRGRIFNVGGGDREWRLALARGVPVDLRVDAGVGRTVAELDGVRLSALDLDAGVGEVRVTLPERGGYAADIDAGVGEVVVRLPSQLAVRATIDTGLGGTRVLGPFERDGDTYTTSGYAQADDDDRVELRINGGVGQVTVERID